MCELTRLNWPRSELTINPERHSFAGNSKHDRKLDDNGYPHDGRADKNPYPHDRRADKDSYPHDSNNQCIILRLQLSFAMINVQLMLVKLISYYSLIFSRFCNNYVLILLFLFVHRLYVEDLQMIQLLLYAKLSIAVGNFAFSSFNW